MFFSRFGRPWPFKDEELSVEHPSTLEEKALKMLIKSLVYFYNKILENPDFSRDFLNNYANILMKIKYFVWDNPQHPAITELTRIYGFGDNRNVITEEYSSEKIFFQAKETEVGHIPWWVNRFKEEGGHDLKNIIREQAKSRSHAILVAVQEESNRLYKPK